MEKLTTTSFNSSGKKYLIGTPGTIIKGTYSEISNITWRDFQENPQKTQKRNYCGIVLEEFPKVLLRLNSWRNYLKNPWGIPLDAPRGNPNEGFEGMSDETPERTPIRIFVRTTKEFPKEPLELFSKKLMKEFVGSS